MLFLSIDFWYFEYLLQSKRYFSVSVEQQVIQGKLALVAEGIAFVMKQITAGIVAFAPVLNCDLTVFREVLLTQQPSELESDEEEMDANDVDEEGYECNGDEDHDLCSDGRPQSPDIVIDAMEKLTVDSMGPVLAEELLPGVFCWRLPCTISQGTYKGRNGSNACSLISLLIGHIFCKTKTQLPTKQSALPDDIIAVVCCSMELGNRVYDLCRDNLPSRFLSVQEAASVLETWLSCTVRNVLPVRLQDPHEKSTMSGQLKLAMASHDSSTSFLIINEKTSFFLTTSNEEVMYIDTHSHPSCGAVVVLSTLQQLSNFCKAIWDLEGYNEKTFGNLAFVDFSL